MWGPLILLVLFSTTDFQALRDAFLRTRALDLVWGYLAVLPTVPLRTWRWQIILGPTFQPPTYGQLLRSYTHAIFVGVVTPGRLGEFVKIGDVIRWGAPTSVAFMKVIVDRLFDIAVMLATGALGFWLLGVRGLGLRGFNAQPWIGAGVIASCLGLVATIALWRDFQRHGRFSRWIGARTPARLRKPLQDLRDEFVATSGMTKLRIHGSAALLSVVAWGFNYLANFFLARALGLDISYIEVAAISALSSLVSLIPITVLGAGTRDATLVVLLAALGKTKAEALAYSTLLLSLILWLGILCAPSAWMSMRRNVRKAEQERT